MGNGFVPAILERGKRAVSTAQEKLAAIQERQRIQNKARKIEFAKRFGFITNKTNEELTDFEVEVAFTAALTKRTELINKRRRAEQQFKAGPQAIRRAQVPRRRRQIRVRVPPQAPVQQRARPLLQPKARKPRFDIFSQNFLP